MFDIAFSPVKLAAEKRDSTVGRSMVMGASTGMIGKVVGFPTDLRKFMHQGKCQRPDPRKRKRPRGRVIRSARRFAGLRPGHRVAKGRALNVLLGSELLGAAGKGTVYIPVYEALHRAFPAGGRKKKADVYTDQRRGAYSLANQAPASKTAALAPRVCALREQVR